MTAAAAYTLMLALISGPLMASVLLGAGALLALQGFARLAGTGLPKPGIAVHVSDTSIFQASSEETPDEHPHPSGKPAHHP